MAEEHIPDRLEVYLNEQRADLELFRLLMQMWLIQMLNGLPPAMGPIALAEMENGVVEVLQTRPNQPDPENNFERMREMMLVRAEAFFQGIRRNKGYPMRNMGEQPKRN
jgi:hypothetical protein